MNTPWPFQTNSSSFTHGETFTPQPMDETLHLGKTMEEAEESDDLQNNQMSFAFEAVLLTVVGLFGIIGNTAATVMFSRMGKVSFDNYVTCKCWLSRVKAVKLG